MRQVYDFFIDLYMHVAPVAFIVFIVLKALHFNIKWLTVLSPIWIYLLLVLLEFIIMGLQKLITHLIEKPANDKFEQSKKVH
jgi:hypothetical protein